MTALTDINVTLASTSQSYNVRMSAACLQPAADGAERNYFTDAAVS